MLKTCKTSETLPLDILNIIFTYRRSLEDAHAYRHFCEQCNHPHLERIQSFIHANEPIQLVLPGFPAKSPNLNKVLGVLPDKGEKLALHFLNDLCEKIKLLYAPGAQLIICSDGHVFADLVEVTDENVDAYNKSISEFITQSNLHYLSLFNLSHVYDDNPMTQKRVKFIETCVQSEEDIRHLVKTTPRELALFNGLEKFLLEDFAYLKPTLSKNALRKKVHALTYAVIQRSHGWSAVIENVFPNAVRLSIHPQPCHLHKLGIYLIPTKNNWLTPWHGVTVLRDGEYELMKKYQVPSNHAKLIFENGHPSYYVIE